DGAALGERGGGAPALDALGERVVGALLGDECVVDGGAAAGGVVALEHLAAGEGADDLLDVGGLAGGVCGVRGLPDVGGDDEGVHRRGQVGERVGGGVGQQVDDEGVRRRGQLHVGPAVRVEVAADRERGGGGSAGPGGEFGQFGEQVDPGSAVGVGGDVEASGELVGRAAEAVPRGAGGQVDAHDVGAPAQQLAGRAHLGAQAQDEHRAPGEGEPVGVVLDPAQGVGAAGFDHAAGDPPGEVVAKGGAGEALAAVGEGERLFGFRGAGDRLGAGGGGGGDDGEVVLHRGLDGLPVDVMGADHAGLQRVEGRAGHAVPVAGVVDAHGNEFGERFD